MRNSAPPPTVHQQNIHVQTHRPFKNFVDIWAEIEDWYAKEITTPNPWQLPTEFLNIDQKREIFRIALREGYLEASLIALVAPFLYGVIYENNIMFPEGDNIIRLVAMLMIGWPYIVIPLLPIIFLRKIRGNITFFISRSFALGRAIGLILCSIIYAMIFVYLPYLLSIVFPVPEGDETFSYFYYRFITTPLSYLENSYHLLISLCVISAVFPVLIYSLYIIKAKQQAELIGRITYGIIQEG